MLPRVLIIAGSDSGGGAGIQADLKTVSALGCFGMTAVTALTAQDTTGVHDIVEVEPAFVARQIEVCVRDIGCDAVKIGMLGSAPIIEAVADTLRRLALHPIVLDPVMVAKGGAALLPTEALAVLKARLLPLADVVTPNLHEAAALVGKPVETLDDMRSATQQIRTMGPDCVVVKGGHLNAEPVDLLLDGKGFAEFHGQRIESRHSHGTGCIFASATAAGLAQGKPVRASVQQAKEFVTAAIRHGLALGKGHGPADPMAWLTAANDTPAACPPGRR